MKMLMMALCLVGATALAKETSNLKFEGAKIYAPLKGSPATAGYATIKNTSDKEVSFTVDAVSPFKAVETHETSEKDGRMAMQKMEKFVIPAKGTLELKPGGNHIMLFEPSRDLKVGEQLTLKYMADGKAFETKFKVVPRMEEKNPHSGMHH